MKTALKRTLSVLLCIVMLLGFATIDVFLGYSIKVNAAESYMWPVINGSANSHGFNCTCSLHKGSHNGQDISGSRYGQAVLSPVDGVVAEVKSGCRGISNLTKKKSCTLSTCQPSNGITYMSKYGLSFCNGGTGNGVTVKESSTGYSFSVAHLAYDPVVKKGDAVRKGQVIGYVGESGCSDGVHLHLSVFKSNGTAFNPMSLSYAYPKTTAASNSIGIFGVRYPINKKSADSFSVSGIVSSSSKISDVSITVTEPSGNVKNFGSASPNTNYYDLNSLDAKAEFSSLKSEGTYLYKITAKDSSGNTVTFSKEFTVSSGDTTYTFSSSNSFSETITVIFDANGGVASASKKAFAVDAQYGEEFPSAVRSGYTFDGWFTSTSGGTQHTHTTKASKSVTKLYAHWTKNNSGVLREGHIYKIYNKKSGLPLQVMGAAARSGISQMGENISESNTQLWRVITATDDGYYRLQSLYGGMAWDLNDGDNKYAYRLPLKTYAPNTNSDAQFFSVIPRGSGYYSIHSKNTGLALDIYGGSTDPNAAVIQWDPHLQDNELYRFEELEDRTIKFYDNYNNNYLPSPAEVYAHDGSAVPTSNYTTRGSGISALLDPDHNGLIINQTVATDSNDMIWDAAISDSNVYGPNTLDNSTMELHFTAKASISGANLQFRWGYDDVSVYYPVALTTEWKDYTLVIPRTNKSADHLHPYLDKVCTAEVRDIALYVKGGSGTIGDTDYYSPQIVIENIYNGTVSGPANPTREGYVFDGWYDRRVGGNLISPDGTVSIDNLPGNLCLYAHWTKAAALHTEHTFTTTVTPATCETEGHTLQVCSICGYTVDTVSPSLGHDIVHTHQDATCVDPMIDEWICSRCGYVEFGGGDDPLGHDFVATVTPETCTEDGSILYQCSRCPEHYTEVTRAHGHAYSEWVKLDDAQHRRTCAYDENHTETEPHNWNSGVVTTEPTATSNGVMTFTCSDCGAVKTEVIQITYESIRIQTMPGKTAYYVGETLNTAGLKLTVTYNNGKTETIASGFTCSPTRLNEAGTQKITVAFGGKTATFNVTVSEDSVTSLQVKYNPYKMNYYVGDAFDPAGLVLTATYASGASAAIETGFTCTPTTLSTAGEQTITIAYGGKTAAIQVHVAQDAMTSLRIATYPTQLNYYIGDQLNTNGLTLTAAYSSGKEETITAGFVCTPTQLNREGSQAITVSYQGLSTTFFVSVEEVPAQNFTVTFMVDGAVYTSAKYEVGMAIRQPTTPTKAGYLFKEWTPALPATMPDHDLTVSAVFDAVTYTAVFIADGVTVAVVNYTANDAAITEPAVPEKVGYDGKWSAYTLAPGGVTVYAVYSMKAYTVTWNVDDKVHHTDTLNFGAPITQPDPPTKEGYTFTGWTPKVPATMPANDLTFHAVFEPVSSNPTANAVLNEPRSATVDYRTDVTMIARATNVPAGYSIAIYDGDRQIAKGNNIEVACHIGKMTASAVYTVKIVDSNNNVQIDGSGNELSKTVEVQVKATFFVRIIAFFRDLFGHGKKVTLEP